MELSINNDFSHQIGLKNYSLGSRLIITTILAILISCYYFPFEFTFLPSGLNTKIILAILGILLLGLEGINNNKIEINNYIFYAILIAIILSLIGYISVDINNSTDYSYANYIISFATWLLAAYNTCTIIKKVHGYLNFELLANYLISICIAQCFFALIIDYNISVKTFIDTYISQNTVADVQFLNKVNRLYGIGAAVDVAGTRFSIVLLILVAVLNQIRDRNDKLIQVTLYWIAFIVISVIGNMISRTTTVGTIMALFYLLLKSNLLNQKLSTSNIKSLFSILTITILLIIITIHYYRTDMIVQEQLRFAFEGFFNWVEKGEWKTDSTDRLNSVMWIWPDNDDIQTWLIGKAIFDDWHALGTDIGYCRFVFYNGLLGLITFSLFFVYNAIVGIKRFPTYKLFFSFLLALTFIIWLKVSTDLFIIYSLFYCIDNERKEFL